jgi:Holliday junction DNA helicase RuvA
MIAKLTGKIVQKKIDTVIVDVNGVGYRVYVLGRVLENLNGEISLFTHLYVREDHMSLYGFLSEEELSLFELLISVSGIGPKAGLGILSVGDTDMIKKAIAEGRSDILKSVSGVGKKTADRMVLELSEKVAKFAGPAPAGEPPTVAADDVTSALVNLGYRRSEAERVVDGIARSGAPADFGDYLKSALKKLTGG